MLNKVRIDKWLWAVRIFKSRSLSADTIRQNKVRVGENVVKPSYGIEQGQIVSVRKGGYNLTFQVEKLIEKRVSATLAQDCYKDLTSQEEYNKFKEWYIGKSTGEFRDKGLGRPTKKERRKIDDFKDRFYDFEDAED